MIIYVFLGIYITIKKTPNRELKTPLNYVGMNV